MLPTIRLVDPLRGFAHHVTQHHAFVRVTPLADPADLESSPAGRFGGHRVGEADLPLAMSMTRTSTDITAFSLACPNRPTCVELDS